MVGRAKITAEETAELQRLYSELPSAIAEAAEAVRAEQPLGGTRRPSAKGTKRSTPSSSGFANSPTIPRRSRRDCICPWTT